MDTPPARLQHAECLELATAERRATLRLPENSGFFTGHFPGQPILPAIGQLQLVSDLLPHWFPERAFELSQLLSLRFQRPLGPGDTFAIQLGEPAEDGRASLLIRQDGAIVSRGAILLGRASDPASKRTSSPLSPDSPAHEFPLPHLGVACWISRILERGTDQLHAEVCVPRASVFCRKSTVHSATSIEAAAQAAALLEALQRADHAGDGQAEARAGYLVGAQDVRLRRPRFLAGAPLRVRVQLTGRAGPLAKYGFQLHDPELGEDGDARMAEGQVSTFIAPAKS